MRTSRKRILTVAAAVVVLVGGAGAAFSYWTSSGSGTGNGTTGTTAPVTAVQTTTIANLRPGGAAQTLSGNFTNTNTGPVYVTNVVVTIASVVKDAGAVAGTCDATDYAITGGTMAVGAEVPVGTAQGAWSGATIAFVDKGTVQDQCKLATVNVSYAVN
jgi:hypothetical protein